VSKNYFSFQSKMREEGRSPPWFDCNRCRNSNEKVCFYHFPFAYAVDPEAFLFGICFYSDTFALGW
jgi:hypothetical protein